MTERQFFYWVMAAAVILPYCAAAVIRWWRRSQDVRTPETKRPNTYDALRNQVLCAKGPPSGSSMSGKPDGPWAVVMDWRLSQAVATVVAVSDGSASIYYSTGGGSIGGAYARPAIRDAALHAVSIAVKFLDHMRLTDSFPLPGPGGVGFYIVTERGVFTAMAGVDLLSTNRHPLTELGNSMQGIITQYRILETSSN